MDLVMPRVNGVEATRRVMKKSPCPILVVTTAIPGHYELVIQAMGAGALDAVETPVLGQGGTISNGQALLARLAKVADANRGASWSGIRLALQPKASSADRAPLVLIGSSTGGPEALAVVLASLPPNFRAATLIAQHIAAEFAPSLATWLSERCHTRSNRMRRGRQHPERF